MRPLTVLAILLFAAPLLGGCLGSIKRSEWAYDDAGLDDLAASGRTGAGVTIAVLDTGINTHHPALDHLVDGDPNNGQLVAFRDFLGNAVGPREAFDDEGHGSHVVGILAARGTASGLYGGVELKGGAPRAQIVVGRVCDTLCDAALLPDAIAWAVGEGADVISLSLGGHFNVTDSVQRLQVEQAIDAAIDAGVVVVASAGNQGASGTDVESPADIPGVIAVGSVGRDGQVSDFSSHGSADNNVCRPTPVPLPIPLPNLPRLLPVVISRCEPDQKPELVAPGEDILSAWADSDYYKASGTSQATPFVTAAVALILEGRSDFTSRAQVEDLKQALVDSARPVDGQQLPHDDGAGYGRLDAAGALLAFES
ncbi:MAG: S8 family serine peptidase [Candidatus Thermoplasmatota archaeon]